jgi:putative transposase
MTSPSPLLYDAYYHIYNRGNNRENIFFQERNYEHFLKLYAKYIEPVAATFAYCLLRNHFHLLVKIRSEDEIGETLKVLGKPLGSDYPSKRFSDFFNAYAKAVNRAYDRTGSLFQHPFGRVLVTNDRQFWNVIAYIHRNPQKHRLVDDFREWRWSSYHTLLLDKPTRLQRETVLEWFGGKQAYVDSHARWISDAENKWLANDDED